MIGEGYKGDFWGGNILIFYLGGSYMDVFNYENLLRYIFRIYVIFIRFIL